MSELAAIPGLYDLWQRTRGTLDVSVAVLDGLVDTDHPCFQGAELKRLPTMVQGKASATGRMSAHGTHIASIIFGQPNSPVEGIASNCRGLVAPVFADNRRKLSQLDLARAIERAAESGANVINISGGSITDFGEAEDWLLRAVTMCRDRNILIVAAAGNNGCDCLHVPAALPAVLAVGAMDAKGKPLDFSNWGEQYQSQGILALGENVHGAKPGGGTMHMTGTSFAAPIVTGVVALLLSLQMQRGENPNPQAVREALLATALPCQADTDGRKCLAGKLNIPGAIEHLTGKTMSESVAESLETGMAETGIVDASDCSCGGSPETEPPKVKVPPQLEIERPELFTPGVPVPPGLSASGASGAIASGVPVASSVAASETATSIAAAEVPANSISVNPVSSQGAIVPNLNLIPSNAVTPSEAESGDGKVYTIGILGYDFGTEARRDSFKQMMPAVEFEGTQVPSNPYDGRQMANYLANNPSEAKSLIWTLNLELTPIYAIEPMGSFAQDVYAVLQEFLAGQVEAEDSDDYIERVSIPGRITGRTVRLFSGQVVPVIEPQSPRGMYGWRINTLISAALEAVGAEQQDAQEEEMRRALSSFLNRVYYDLRNLGQTSQDRALNFAATNAFQVAQTFSAAVGAGMELDSINVQKSPFCRMDSDCWDVQLKFFDPENNRRAKRVFRFTIDVSDFIPVTLGEVRSWSSPY